jgi:integrase family protein
MKKTEALELAKYYASWMGENIMCKSANTVRAYSFAVKLFMEFLETAKGIHQTSFCICTDLSYDNIVEWQSWLRGIRKCSAESCNARLASLKSFLKYLSIRDLKYRYLYLASLNVRRQKESKRKVIGMSEIAVKSLLQEPDVHTTTGYRDVMFMTILYGTAARLDEILSIKVGDLELDVENAYITVRGKGNKLRTLYLPPKVVSNLHKYIGKFHGKNADPENYLFYSRVKGYKSKITQEAMNKRLKIYARAVHTQCQDVPIDLHAHQFRHAKSTHLLNDGMNVAQLSKLLGHAQLSTTMVYLDITTDMQAKAMIEMEDEETKSIPRKWGKGSDKLSSLFDLEK